MFVWLMIIGYGAFLRLVICVNMMNGTMLVADPYAEGVFIQKKPSTTICMGIIIDEKTVFTSSLCEVGLEPVTSYHVVEAPHYKAPPPSLVHNIKTIQRGKGTPFDLKIIILEEPFEFCANCSAAKVEWVETYDDYIYRFDLGTPGIILGFGPPFKAGVVKYKAGGYADCQQDYLALRDASWPSTLPIEGGFCIYEGSVAVNISIPNKIRPVTTSPGVPCDDSIGSLVKINVYDRTLGILLTGLCGAKKLALGYGSYYLNALPFEPDDWTPPPLSTTTSSTTTPVTPITNKTSSSTTTTTKTSTVKPRTEPTTDPANPSEAINISNCFLIEIFAVVAWFIPIK